MASGVAGGQDAGGTRCQVEGCQVDISGLKKYFRRYHACEAHIRAQVVLIGGQQRRFCDQCSTFHPLSHFDGSRRTCREKLEHNRQKRRLRKAQNAGGTAGGDGGGTASGGNPASGAPGAAAAAGAQWAAVGAARAAACGSGRPPSDDADSNDQPYTVRGLAPDGDGEEEADEGVRPTLQQRDTDGRARKRQSATTVLPGSRRQHPAARQAAGLGVDVTRALHGAGTAAGGPAAGGLAAPEQQLQRQPGSQSVEAETEDEADGFAGMDRGMDGRGFQWGGGPAPGLLLPGARRLAGWGTQRGLVRPGMLNVDTSFSGGAGRGAEPNGWEMGLDASMDMDVDGEAGSAPTPSSGRTPVMPWQREGLVAQQQQHPHPQRPSQQDLRDQGPGHLQSPPPRGMYPHQQQQQQHLNLLSAHLAAVGGLRSGGNIGGTGAGSGRGAPQRAPPPWGVLQLQLQQQQQQLLPLPGLPGLQQLAGCRDGGAGDWGRGGPDGAAGEVRAAVEELAAQAAAGGLPAGARRPYGGSVPNLPKEFPGSLHVADAQPRASCPSLPRSLTSDSTTTAHQLPAEGPPQAQVPTAIWAHHPAQAAAPAAMPPPDAPPGTGTQGLAVSPVGGVSGSMGGAGGAPSRGQGGLVLNGVGGGSVGPRVPRGLAPEQLEDAAMGSLDAAVSMCFSASLGLGRSSSLLLQGASGSSSLLAGGGSSGASVAAGMGVAAASKDRPPGLVGMANLQREPSGASSLSGGGNGRLTPSGVPPDRLAGPALTAYRLQLQAGLLDPPPPSQLPVSLRVAPGDYQLRPWPPHPVQPLAPPQHRMYPGAGFAPLHPQQQQQQQHHQRAAQNGIAGHPTSAASPPHLSGPWVGAPNGPAPPPPQQRPLDNDVSLFAPGDMEAAVQGRRVSHGSSVYTADEEEAQGRAPGGGGPLADEGVVDMVLSEVAAAMAAAREAEEERELDALAAAAAAGVNVWPAGPWTGAGGAVGGLPHPPQLHQQQHQPHQMPHWQYQQHTHAAALYENPPPQQQQQQQQGLHHHHHVAARAQSPAQAQPQSQQQPGSPDSLAAPPLEPVGGAADAPPICLTESFKEEVLMLQQKLQERDERRQSQRQGAPEPNGPSPQAAPQPLAHHQQGYPPLPPPQQQQQPQQQQKPVSAVLLPPPPPPPPPHQPPPPPPHQQRPPPPFAQQLYSPRQQPLALPRGGTDDGERQFSAFHLQGPGAGLDLEEDDDDPRPAPVTATAARATIAAAATNNNNSNRYSNSSNAAFFGPGQPPQALQAAPASGATGPGGGRGDGGLRREVEARLVVGREEEELLRQGYSLGLPAGLSLILPSQSSERALALTPSLQLQQQRGRQGQRQQQREQQAGAEQQGVQGQRASDVAAMPPPRSQDCNGVTRGGSSGGGSGVGRELDLAAPGVGPGAGGVLQAQPLRSGGGSLWQAAGSSGAGSDVGKALTYGNGYHEWGGGAGAGTDAGYGWAGLRGPRAPPPRQQQEQQMQSLRNARGTAAASTGQSGVVPGPLERQRALYQQQQHQQQQRHHSMAGRWDEGDDDDDAADAAAAAAGAFSGRSLGVEQAPYGGPFYDGGVPGGGGGGSLRLSHVAMKLSHAHPDSLPGDLGERLQAAIRQAGAAALPPAIRAGCIELLVEVLHRCPTAQLCEVLFDLPAPGPHTAPAARAQAARSARERLRQLVGPAAFDGCERVTMQLLGGPVLSCLRGQEPQLLDWREVVAQTGLGPGAAAWADLPLLLQAGPPVLVAEPLQPQDLVVYGPPGLEDHLGAVRLLVRMAGGSQSLGTVQVIEAHTAAAAVAVVGGPATAAASGTAACTGGGATAPAGIPSPGPGDGWREGLGHTQQLFKGDRSTVQELVQEDPNGARPACPLHPNTATAAGAGTCVAPLSIDEGSGGVLRGTGSREGGGAARPPLGHGCQAAGMRGLQAECGRGPAPSAVAPVECAHGSGGHGSGVSGTVPTAGPAYPGQAADSQAASGAASAAPLAATAPSAGAACFPDSLPGSCFLLAPQLSLQPSVQPPPPPPPAEGGPLRGLPTTHMQAGAPGSAACHTADRLLLACQLAAGQHKGAADEGPDSNSSVVSTPSSTIDVPSVCALAAALLAAAAANGAAHNTTAATATNTYGPCGRLTRCRSDRSSASITEACTSLCDRLSLRSDWSSDGTLRSSAPSLYGTISTGSTVPLPAACHPHPKHAPGPATSSATPVWWSHAASPGGGATPELAASPPTSIPPPAAPQRLLTQLPSGACRPAPLRLRLPAWSLRHPGLMLLEAVAGHCVAGCWPVLVVETAGQREELAALWTELAGPAGRQSAWRDLAVDLGLVLAHLPRKSLGLTTQGAESEKAVGVQRPPPLEAAAAAVAVVAGRNAGGGGGNQGGVDVSGCGLDGLLSTGSSHRQSWGTLLSDVVSHGSFGVEASVGPPSRLPSPPSSAGRTGRSSGHRGAGVGDSGGSSSADSDSGGGTDICGGSWSGGWAARTQAPLVGSPSAAAVLGPAASNTPPHAGAVSDAAVSVFGTTSAAVSDAAPAEAGERGARRVLAAVQLPGRGPTPPKPMAAVGGAAACASNPGGAACGAVSSSEPTAGVPHAAAGSPAGRRRDRLDLEDLIAAGAVAPGRQGVSEQEVSDLASGVAGLVLQSSQIGGPDGRLPVALVCGSGGSQDRTTAAAAALAGSVSWEGNGVLGIDAAGTTGPGKEGGGSQPERQRTPVLPRGAPGAVLSWEAAAELRGALGRLRVYVDARPLPALSELLSRVAAAAAAPAGAVPGEEEDL